MEQPEVPLEQTQEEILHHAHGTSEKWVLGVALTAALLAVFAAITSLIAEHQANVLNTKAEILSALGKTMDEKEKAKLEKYEKEQADIKDKARELQSESKMHLEHHTVLASSVTMFQIAIAVGAIAVLTKRRQFWFGSIAFGGVGVAFFIYALLMK